MQNKALKHIFKDYYTIQKEYSNSLKKLIDNGILLIYYLIMFSFISKQPTQEKIIN